MNKTSTTRKTTTRKTTTRKTTTRKISVPVVFEKYLDGYGMVVLATNSNVTNSVHREMATEPREMALITIGACGAVPEYGFYDHNNDIQIKHQNLVNPNFKWKTLPAKFGTTSNIGNDIWDHLEDGIETVVKYSGSRQPKGKHNKSIVVYLAQNGGMATCNTLIKLVRRNGATQQYAQYTVGNAINNGLLIVA